MNRIKGDSLILLRNYHIDKLFKDLQCFNPHTKEMINKLMKATKTIEKELNKNINKGLVSFIKKAIPLTLLTTVAYLISLFYLNNYYELDEAVYKVIFIGLASLTFPHILLEYLIEKNEK